MSVTATLRECHRLRKHLKTLQEEIDRGPRVQKAQQARLAQEQQAQKDHHDAITKLKLKQREDEGTLKQTETRLAKLEEQLTGISVQKEFEAKRSEIRQAQEKRTALEDAVLATMGAVEEKTAAIPAVEKRWADAQAEFARQQEEGKARLERLKTEQAEARATLATTEAAVPEKVRSTYDYLVKAHGPEAFAAVKEKVCQGCRTGMTDQKSMELRNGSFMLCSSCGKMLYPAE
jgi:predicted  nucleic acid-binding Zn-ribbon protein